MPQPQPLSPPEEMVELALVVGLLVIRQRKLPLVYRWRLPAALSGGRSVGCASRRRCVIIPQYRCLIGVVPRLLLGGQRIKIRLVHASQGLIRHASHNLLLRIWRIRTKQHVVHRSVYLLHGRPGCVTHDAAAPAYRPSVGLRGMPPRLNPAYVPVWSLTSPAVVPPVLGFLVVSVAPTSEAPAPAPITFGTKVLGTLSAGVTVVVLSSVPGVEVGATISGSW